MATLTIRGNTFTPRSPSVSIVGQVNAEQVTFVADESWRGLELQAQFSNTSIDRDPVPVALDETMTCYVPAEATAQPGKVYVALAGYDDGVKIKLTELLHYSNAKVGADPNGGVPPEEQAPSYLNQITQILNETKEVAQSVRNDADNGLFDGEPGKSPIIQDGNWWIWDVEAQEYRDTGVAASGGGTGGTTDYTELSNKPQINGVELLGNKTAQDLGLQPKGDYATTSSKLSNPYFLTFAGAVEATYDGSKAVTVTIPTVAGPAGVSPTVSTEEIDGGTRVVFMFQGGSETVDILDGVTPNLDIGTVETLEPGTDATATITGTPESPRLNLGIPRGQNGKNPVKGIDYFTDEEIQAIASQAAALVPGGNSEPAELLNFTVEDSSITFYKVDAIGYRTFAVLVVFKPDEEITIGINGGIAINASRGPWDTGYRVDVNIQNLPYSSSAVAKAVFYLFSVGAGYIIPIMAVSSGNKNASAYYLTGPVSPGFKIDRDTNSLNPFSEEVQSISVGSYTKYFGRGSKILVLGWK